MKKYILTLTIALLLFFLVSCGEKSNNDLLEKAEVLESVGELDSAIVVFKTFILKNPKHWNSRLNIARLYREVGDINKEKIVYDRIILSENAPDSVTTLAINRYDTIIRNEFKSLMDKIDKSIKDFEPEIIAQLAPTLVRTIKSYPRFNRKYSSILDSTIWIPDYSFGMRHDDYAKAIAVNEIAYHLFSLPSSYNRLYEGQLFLQYSFPLSPEERKLIDKENVLSDKLLADHLLSEQLTFISLFWASDFWEQEKWDYSAKAYGLLKNYAKRPTKDWDRLAMSAAKQEAMAYYFKGFNNTDDSGINDVGEAIKLLTELLEEVPNVDEILEANITVSSLITMYESYQEHRFEQFNR